MKIYLATDHAGFELKEKVKEFLTKEGYEIEDFGAHHFDKNDDFTDFISKAGEAVASDPLDRGIIFGGSGQGEAMLANKYPHVRTVVFYGQVKPIGVVDVSGKRSDDGFEMIKLSRMHNNSNVLSFGARFVSEEDTIKAVRLWLTTPFSAEERHARRIEKIEEIESNLCRQT